MVLKEREQGMWILIMIKLLRAFVLFIILSPSYADLISLDDTILKEIDGEGIGVVLENFVYEAGEQTSGGGTFEISGLENSNGQAVVFGVSQFYISGNNSNRGTNVINNPVNLGRLLYPYNIELRDGEEVGVSNKAVLELSAPNKLIDSSYFQARKENRTERRFPGRQVASGQRVDAITGFNTNVFSTRNSEKADLGIRFDLEVNNARAQSLEGHTKELALDGSYVRLWGGGNRVESEVNLNIFAKQIEFRACDSSGNNCGTSVSFNDVGIEAELGAGEFQPVTFEVNSDGHFNFSVGTLEGKCSTNSTGGCVSGTQKDILVDYYNNGPSTNAFIGNVSVGGQNFGSTTISNLQIQYLEVTSHDL